MPSKHNGRASQALSTSDWKGYRSKCALGQKGESDVSRSSPYASYAYDLERVSQIDHTRALRLCKAVSVFAKSLLQQNCHTKDPA